MIDLGPCRHYLGMEVTRDRKNHVLVLSQRSYLKTVLERFGMVSSTLTSTPLVDRLLKTSEDVAINSFRKEAYQASVGSIMYAMTETCLDLAIAVNKVSQYSVNSGPEHLEAIKRIFRYIAGTLDLVLWFEGKKDETLTGYVDADWGGNLSTKRSTTGYLFFVYNCLVSWSCKKQASVALSTCEAKYAAATQATKELIWLD